MCTDWVLLKVTPITPASITAIITGICMSVAVASAAEAAVAEPVAAEATGEAAPAVEAAQEGDSLPVNRTDWIIYGYV